MLGALGKRLVVLAVLALIAVVALRLVIGIVVGLAQTVLFGLAVVGVLIAGFWALRRL